jgi:predicted ArsR family transcriptional regulator
MSDRWEIVGLLTDPQRREIYELVRSASSPLTRDSVVEQLGIGRPLAVFHLEKLAKAGLLKVSYARPAGRGGPGSGRPSKQYTASDVEIVAALPPRRYDLAGRVLARAAAEAATPELDRRMWAIATEEGRAVGSSHRSAGARRGDGQLVWVAAVLADLGYEPRRRGPTIRLSNCPFRALSSAFAEVICPLNQRFLQGVLDGLGASSDVYAILDSLPDGCCVTLRSA